VSVGIDGSDSIVPSTAANGLTVDVTRSALPTGAATESTLDARSGALTETAPASDTASSGLNGRLQRIAQRLTSLIALLPASLGQKTMANALAVSIASDQSTLTTKQAGTAGGQTSVASTVTTNTTLIAADVNRFGLTIYNESTAILFVLLGAGTESATVYSVQVAAGGYLEVPDSFVTLRASGHWASANGSARITAAT
jgi:hypothetical protein